MLPASSLRELFLWLRRITALSSPGICSRKCHLSRNEDNLTVRVCFAETNNFFSLLAHRYAYEISQEW